MKKLKKIKIITSKQKLILIGIPFLCLLLIEGSLRLSGWIYYLNKIKKETKLQNAENITKILCLGDSFTFGSGVEIGYSYPEQLEEILNENNLSKKFVVYNRGGCIPGLNSSQLLKILEKNIIEYQPNIIIVLIGMHNRCNLTDSNYFLFTDKGIKVSLIRLDGILNRFCTYKFLKIALGNLRHKITKKFPFQNNLKKMRYIDYELKMKPERIAKTPEAESYFKLATESQSHKADIAVAIENYEKVIQLEPDNDVAYAALGRIYENQTEYEMAIEKLKKAVELNPQNLFARDRLWNVYYKQGKNKEAIEQVREILEIEPHNEGLKQMIKWGLPNLKKIKENKILNQLLSYDLEKIIKLAKAKEIKPILLSYPINNDGDEVRRGLANKYRIPFVDIFSVFNKLRTSTYYSKEYYFAKDGHCNAKGYKVMAEEIYKAICSMELNN